MAGGWIADLFGYKDLYDALSVLQVRRKALRVLGARVADNPALGTSDLIVAGGVAPGTDMPDATNTYTWSPAQQLRTFQPGILTDNRSITLGAIGPSLGDEWAFMVFPQAHTIAFVNGGIGAGTMFTTATTYCGTFVGRFNGTDWQTVRI